MRVRAFRSVCFLGIQVDKRNGADIRCCRTGCNFESCRLTLLPYRRSTVRTTGPVHLPVIPIHVYLPDRKHSRTTSADTAAVRARFHPSRRPSPSKAGSRNAGLRRLSQHQNHRVVVPVVCHGTRRHGDRGAEGDGASLPDKIDGRRASTRYRFIRCQA